MTAQATIAAVATAPGPSALSVIRVSGPDAIPVVDRCFQGTTGLADVQARLAQFGRMVRDEVVDQVVVTVFRAPASATGEDLVEVSCHGGSVVARRVLAALFEAGAEPAEPGAFTRRAFVNGKLDLAQAEAVAALIHASSIASQRVAIRELEGRYSDLIGRLREELIEAAAFVELELDFTEEDVEFADRDQLEGLLDRAKATIGSLLASAPTGARIRDGVRVVIAGRPNAGKSTLLNALLGQERVIVSDTPGTTRDLVEAEAEIDGILYRFSDTAGIRDTDEAIEAEGVLRARAALASADVVVLLWDASVGWEAPEQAVLSHAEEAGVPVIQVANKVDLKPPTREGLGISALAARESPEHLDDVVAAIRGAALGGVSLEAETPLVVHERHVAHLRRTHEAIERAGGGLALGASGDLLAPDLRDAARELGAITGAVTNDEILGAIFSRFCIGK